MMKKSWWRRVWQRGGQRRRVWQSGNFIFFLFFLRCFFIHATTSVYKLHGYIISSVIWLKFQLIASQKLLPQNLIPKFVRFSPQSQRHQHQWFNRLTHYLQQYRDVWMYGKLSIWKEKIYQNECYWNFTSRFLLFAYGLVL